MVYMIGRINKRRGFVAHKGPSSVNLCVRHAPSYICVLFCFAQSFAVKFKIQHVITAGAQKILAVMQFSVVTNVEVVSVSFGASQRSDIHNCAF